MIGHLRGVLLDKQAPHLLLEVAGVGYEVDAPMTVFYRLPEVGQELSLYTHYVVREDAQLLYGFVDRQERELFRTLIKVNGVGPKLALTILSGIEGAAFVRCVHDNDTASLVKLPGVGKKTAERLIVEMKDKLDALGDAFAVLPGVIPDSVVSIRDLHDATHDAISALVALGYKPAEASRAISRVDADGLSSEELIRLSLKGLG